MRQNIPIRETAVFCQKSKVPVILVNFITHRRHKSNVSFCFAHCITLKTEWEDFFLDSLK